MFLYREDYCHSYDTQKKAEIIIAKHRYGDTGTVDMKYIIGEDGLRFYDKDD